MPATVFTFILTVSTLCGSRGVLHAPRNVEISSNNMDLVLSWDPPADPTHGLLYRTEFNSSVSKYRVGCLNTSALRCDLTSLDINLYGTYTARVRAELGAESSVWVESPQIILDKNTNIGPPSVSLISNGATIEVSITDPVFKISELRRAYNYATYNITYWKEGQQEKAVSISNVQQNRVVVNTLQPWTRYCFQVQIHTDRNLRPSEPSSITCGSTTSKEEAPWVAAVVTFVVMAMVVTLVVVAVVHRKKIFHFLCPKDSLPQHFKEYLLEPPTSSIYLAMRDSHPPEEVYHQVSIITDGRTVEEERPPEAGGSDCSKPTEITEGET
ncbi:interleukin-10 receptor subunit beta-like [Centroberyx gerrardi]|uniref:interleukin-10 receptor subunit beta-like n=1 Tax=Centroberyx gerrardi TaxID=166262 RepID=UPI003AB07920